MKNYPKTDINANECNFALFSYNIKLNNFRNQS